MFINLSNVLSEPHRPVEETVSLTLDEICMKHGKFPVVDKSDVHVKVTFIKDKQLEIIGDTKLWIEIPCDRCLETVTEEFQLDFTKRVDLSVSDEDNAFSDEFDESNYIDGYTLDVDMLVYNEVLIGWPTKILCRNDCKGICNVCGQNLNQGTCDCDDTSLDPRMSVIRDVFKNFKEV